MMYRNVIRKAAAANLDDPKQPKNFDHIPFTEAELKGAKVIRAFYHGKDERWEIVGETEDMFEIAKLRKDGERYKRRNHDMIWKTHVVEIYEIDAAEAVEEIEDVPTIELPSDDFEAIKYIAEQVAAQYHKVMGVEVEVKETTYRYNITCNRFTTTVDSSDFARRMRELAGDRFTIELMTYSLITAEVSSDERLRRFLASKLEDAFAIMDEYKDGGHVELVYTHDEDASYPHGIELAITGYTFEDDKTHQVDYETKYVLITRTHMEHIARSYGERAYRIITAAIEDRNERGGAYFEVMANPLVLY